MNQKLLDLYNNNAQKIFNINDTFRESVNGPFLIDAPDEYVSADKKIMIIGQQTAGWSSYTYDVQKQMKTYADFNFGEKYFHSPFWSFFHQIKQRLTQDGFEAIWTNINKFDYKRVQPKGEVERRIQEIDFLLQEEIDILKPDVCIFVTGPTLDKRIKKLFSGVKYDKIEGWRQRQLTRLNCSNLPDDTFRTYHPNYLRRSGLEKACVDKIVGLISD